MSNQLLAKDLRIGNIVLRREFLPRNLDDCRFDEIVVTHNDITACHINNTHFKPIPLTEEWLLKFGFEQKSLHYFKENIFVITLEDGYFECLLGNYEVKLKYAHELQNLYWALSGKELTIKEGTK
jgi:hypothetical protein